MKIALLAVLLLATSLAGCTASQVPDDEFSDVGLDGPTATTGIIRGVIIDESINPIVGATILVVGLDEQTSSNEAGAFGFSNLQPGTYFLEVMKLGFAKVQVNAEVTAGVEQPPILKVSLARLPGTEPYISPMQWDGFMACSWNIVVGFYTGCGLGEQLGDQSRQYDDLGARPAWLQSELVWENTQPAGENLCMRHYASSGIGGDILGDACGPSPQVFTVDSDKVEETGLGNTRGLERVVWVDFWLAPQTAGVAVDQTFTVFTHSFHNFMPVEGWQFTVDGDHSVPTV